MNHDEDKKTTSTENEAVTESDVANADVTNESQSVEQQATAEQPATDNIPDERENDMNIEKTWHNKNALKRGIAMLGFGFIAGFVRVGITLIAIFQFFSLLFAEKPNMPLVKFGLNLNTYLYQINQFLTVNSEMYPFPFADWPDSTPN